MAVICRVALACQDPKCQSGSSGAFRAALTAPLEEAFEQRVSVHGPCAFFPVLHVNACGGFQTVPQPQEFRGRLFLIQIPPTEKQTHLAHHVRTHPPYAALCQAV